MLARLLAGLLAAVALLPAPSAASTPDTAPALSARLAQALAVPHVDHARSAALALDLETGDVVFARNSALPLRPASTEKLALTYALLSTFGPGYRISTEVLGRGRLDGTTWVGDLVLKGYGDPTLTTAGLRRLAAQLLAHGVTRVTGAVIGDESFFDGRRVAPGWKRSFYIEESPPLSALAVDRASYGPRRVAYRPGLVAAQMFRKVLAEAGIAVLRRARLGAASGGEEPLARIASQPLLSLLRAVDADSDNFTAEVLLKHLGATQVGRGTTPAGAAVVRKTLRAAGIPLAGVRIVDGSGLSLLDRLTADSLVALLVSAWDDPVMRGALLSSLAVSGRSGTLERRLDRPPVLGRVFAKTGTTSRSSALAGYVGGRYAFAVLHNGSPVATWWAREAQDRFVTALARRS